MRVWQPSPVSATALRPAPFRPRFIPDTSGHASSMPRSHPCLASCRTWPPHEETEMSFKLTYSTMFDPPAELHTRFEDAMARTVRLLGRSHALHIGGEDRPSVKSAVSRNPADQ